MSLTRHFCCCLPVRLGVFVLSLFSLLGGGSYAAALWYAYYLSERHDQVSFTTTQKIAFIATAVVYTVLAVAALLGLVGAIRRKQSLVEAYSTFMWFQLAAQVAVSVLLVYALFNNNEELVKKCEEQVSETNSFNSNITGTNTQVDTSKCQVFSKGGHAGVITGLIFSLLIELYCCFIVSRYISQLNDEKSFRATTRLDQIESRAGGTSGFYPHEPIHARTELINKEDNGNSYPYAQSRHSYGNKV